MSTFSVCSAREGDIRDFRDFAGGAGSDGPSKNEAVNRAVDRLPLPLGAPPNVPNVPEVHGAGSGKVSVIDVHRESHYQYP